MAPNRIAVYFTAAAALAAALVPAIANLDITSTVGIVGGVGALAGIVAVWLRGWQSYEERTALEPLAEEMRDPAQQLVTPEGGAPPAGAVGGKAGDPL